MLQPPVRSFQEDSLLLTTKPVGVLGTLLIDLTMKPSRGFEQANLRLVISKQLINYSFILARQCINYLKYKLNTTNKVYLHPIRTSSYFKSVSSCRVTV